MLERISSLSIIDVKVWLVLSTCTVFPGQSHEIITVTFWHRSRKITNPKLHWADARLLSTAEKRITLFLVQFHFTSPATRSCITPGQNSFGGFEKACKWALSTRRSTHLYPYLPRSYFSLSLPHICDSNNKQEVVCFSCIRRGVLNNLTEHITRNCFLIDHLFINRTADFQFTLIQVKKSS